MVRILVVASAGVPPPLFYFFVFFVARVSEAKPGDDIEDCNAAPGYRFAHPGYLRQA
jgi:hypothetical protein